ncbi:hypothetical protein GNI_166750, partial [Gregarina niphandrodes]
TPSGGSSITSSRSGVFLAPASALARTGSCHSAGSVGNNSSNSDSTTRRPKTTCAAAAPVSTNFSCARPFRNTSSHTSSALVLSSRHSSNRRSIAFAITDCTNLLELIPTSVLPVSRPSVSADPVSESISSTVDTASGDIHGVWDPNSCGMSYTRIRLTSFSQSNVSSSPLSNFHECSRGTKTTAEHACSPGTLKSITHGSQSLMPGRLPSGLTTATNNS